MVGAFECSHPVQKVSKLKGVLVLDGENNDDDGSVFRHDGDCVQNGSKPVVAKNQFFSIQSLQSKS